MAMAGWMCPPVPPPEIKMRKGRFAMVQEVDTGMGRV